MHVQNTALQPPMTLVDRALEESRQRELERELVEEHARYGTQRGNRLCPVCMRPVLTAATGRRRRTCSNACRVAMYERRRRLLAHLELALRVALDATASVRRLVS